MWLLWCSAKIERQVSEKDEEQEMTKWVHDDFIEEMKKIMQKHAHKGNIWKTCDIKYLENKLDEEIMEYLYATEYKTSEEQASELIDVANVVMMLWERKK